MSDRKTKPISNSAVPSKSSDIATPAYTKKQPLEVTVHYSRQVITQDISCDCIHPNPFQSREYFDSALLEDLASSIREHGVITRVRVRPDPTKEGQYQLVYGERRWRAAQIAGLTSIPCELADYSDKELIEIGLIENIQRENLGPLEEAKIFRRLLGQAETPFKNKKPYSIRSLAHKIGKNKNYIEDRISLLRLPEDVLQILEAHPKVSLRALNEVAKLPTVEARAPLVSQLKDGTMSTEAVRTVVNAVLKATHTQSQIEQMTNIEEEVEISPQHPSASYEETDHLVFERAFNRSMRRMDSALAQLEEVASLYISMPDARKKEQITAYAQEIVERVQSVIARSDESGHTSSF
jgi:ParB family transcriptional regulator, chromosome partitioning protein